MLMLALFKVCDSSGADLRTLAGHSGPVHAVSFNFDNTFLISGSEDGTS